MIKIVELNKNKLLEFVNSESFGKGDNIPITIHRALSQVKNPYLDEKDVILFLAYNGDKMVGYLGVLPKMLFFSNGSKEKIGWLSCLWVAANVRGKGISTSLISHALEKWDHKAILADYVPATKKIYDKTKAFCESPYSKTGLRLYLKADLQTILPQKKAWFKKLKWLLKGIDFCLNTLAKFKISMFSENAPDLVLEQVNHLDNEVNEFISPKQQKQLFKRSTEDLNWIINNPWIINQESTDELNKKYYFSSTAKSFGYHAIKVRNPEQELIAFMILTERDKVLKLPYLYHNNCIDEVIEILNYLIIKWEIKTFTTFHTDLAHRLKQVRTPAIFKKEVKRNYLVSLALKDTVFCPENEIEDGDGDCCFT